MLYMVQQGSVLQLPSYIHGKLWFTMCSDTCHSIHQHSVFHMLAPVNNNISGVIKVVTYWCRLCWSDLHKHVQFTVIVSCSSVACLKQLSVKRRGGSSLASCALLIIVSYVVTTEVTTELSSSLQFIPFISFYHSQSDYSPTVYHQHILPIQLPPNSTQHWCHYIRLYLGLWTPIRSNSEFLSSGISRYPFEKHCVINHIKCCPHSKTLVRMLT